MFLIIGLGNPGKHFDKTRHNAGFRFLDGFASKNSFSVWENREKMFAEISEGHTGKENVILAKPQTFMNGSGKAVFFLAKNFRVGTKKILVIHDDTDLPLGKIKICFGRGPAGHKGVTSIIRELKTKSFARIRVGTETAKHKNIENFVLTKFNRDEEKILKQIEEKIYGAIETIIEKGIETAMNKFN